MKAVRNVVPVLALLFWPALGLTAQGTGDPPARVGRISFIGGAVSFRPGGADDWSDATLNYPLTAGDGLWADADSRAEVTLGSTAIRLGPYTGIEFFALGDATAQVRLSEGSLQVRVRTLRDGEIIEIDTPNGAVSLLRPGSYRVDTDSAGEATTITVRLGEAQVTAGGSAFSVRTRQMATVSGTDEPTYDIGTAPAPDSWDQWSAARDLRSDNARSARYVSRDMPGYEDLDDYGDWTATDAYGPVWIPRHVAPEWAPYRYGHWRWVDPWGWTWIDDAPWGFAPFHYGRWVYMRGAWGWAPGRLVAVRPVYAPALVVFIGNAQIGVGWFPLAPGEVYYPAYHVSSTYVRNVNVTTVNVTNLRITNVDITRINYRNREAPRALTLVGRETFVGGRPIGRGALQVPRDRSRLAVVGTAPAVAPTRESMQPRRAEGTAGAVRRPPEATLARRVVVKNTPPPAPLPFVLREKALHNNPGRPVDPATMAKLRSGAGAEGERRVRPSAPSPSAPSAQAPAQRPLRRAPLEGRAIPNVTPPRPQPTPPQPAARPAPAPVVPPARPERRGQQPPPAAQPAQPAPPAAAPAAPPARPERRRPQPPPPAAQPPQPAAPGAPAPAVPPARPERRGQRPPPAAQPPQPAAPPAAAPEAPPARPERGRPQPPPPAAEPSQPAQPAQPVQPGQAQPARPAQPAAPSKGQDQPARGRSQPDSGADSARGRRSRP